MWAKLWARFRPYAGSVTRRRSSTAPTLAEDIARRGAAKGLSKRRLRKGEVLPEHMPADFAAPSLRPGAEIATVDFDPTEDMIRYAKTFVDWTTRGRMSQVEPAKILKKLGLPADTRDRWCDEHGQAFGTWIRNYMRALGVGLKAAEDEAELEGTSIKVGKGKGTKAQRQGFSDRRLQLRRLNPKGYAGKNVGKGGAKAPTINIGSILVALPSADRDVLDTTLNEVEPC